MPVRLTYATFLARDPAALCAFYVAGLGLAEIVESRGPHYGEVQAGGAKIGFADAAYAGGQLQLPVIEPAGTRSLLTFDVGGVAALAPAIERAVMAGAGVVRAAQDTAFGQHQAVLADPEGNVFRLSAAIGS